MYIRLVKSGKYHYVRMVESYRDKATGKVHQRLVCNLFRLDTLSDQNVRAIKSVLEKRLNESSSPDSDFQVETVRDFGNIIFLHEVWIQLGLDQALRTASS